MKEVLAVVEALTGLQAHITWSGAVEPHFAGWRRATGLVSSQDGQPVGVLNIIDDGDIHAELTLRTPSGVRQVRFGVGRFPIEAFHRPYRSVAWWGPGLSPEVEA